MKKVGVKYIIYISLFGVINDNMVKFFVGEYVVIEVVLKVFGIIYIILCNGWYMENYIVLILVVLVNNVFYGLVKNGKILFVFCVEFVEVVVNVLLSEGYEN